MIPHRAGAFHALMVPSLLLFLLLDVEMEGLYLGHFVGAKTGLLLSDYQCRVVAFARDSRREIGRHLGHLEILDYFFIILFLLLMFLPTSAY